MVYKDFHVNLFQAVLKSQEMLSKSFLVDVFREWLGDGLAFSTDLKWRSRRHSITPAFHFTILNDFVDIFEKHAEKLVQKLAALSAEKDFVEIQWLAKLSTLDVICETSMGVSVNALNSDSEYVQAVERITKFLFKRFVNPLYLFSKTIYKMTANGREYYKYLDVIHKFTRKVILENIAARNNDKENIEPNEGESSRYDMDENYNDKNGSRYRKKKQVLIDTLLDMYERNEIDMEGIQEEVDTFMFAGHDTTSTTLSWTLYEIGRHPDVMRKLQDEIGESCSLHPTSLIDRVRSLKYMETVIKESLRIHPPVGGYGREVQHDTVVNNHIIPKGTLLLIDTFSLHMNPDYWEQPDIFEPNRFTPEEIAKRSPYCFVPFSAGPRNCIGQKYALLEEKVFLSCVLARFDVTSLQSPDEIVVGTDAITHSVNGINIKFTERK